VVTVHPLAYSTLLANEPPPSVLWTFSQTENLAATWVPVCSGTVEIILTNSKHQNCQPKPNILNIKYLNLSLEHWEAENICVT